MSITRDNSSIKQQVAQMDNSSTLWRFGASCGRTLWSLRKTLVLSILLGLILAFIAGKASPRPVVWAVCLCIALACGKVISERNPLTVALFALLGIVASLAINDNRLITTEWVEMVRAALYPVIGYTVCKLEQRQQEKLVKASQWLFPFVVIPITAGLLVAVDQQNPWKVVAEIVFAAGCGLILHIQPVPESNKTASVVS